MHRLLKQQMVRSVVAQLVTLINDTAVIPTDIIIVLDELLRIAQVEMVACGVHQMREYLYMALLIVPWKSQRLKVIFKRNLEETLKGKIRKLLSRYIDVEFYGSTDGKYTVAGIAERISKIIDCHLTDESEIAEMLLACEHIQQKQQLELHNELICALFKNHFYLGIRSSQLVVKFPPFMELYGIWLSASTDKHDRIQLNFLIKTNASPPAKTKRSFFSIAKYFDSDDSSEGDYSDEAHESCFTRRKSKKPEVHYTERSLKIKAAKECISMDDKDVNARHLIYQSYMSSIEKCLNS